MFARIIILCFIFIATTGFGPTDSKNSVVAEITAKFSRAVEEKNADHFKSLFLNEKVSWFAIISEQDLNRNKANPTQKKVNLQEIGPFSEWLVKTQEATEVKFSDCKASGDADVMVADCEYAFSLGGIKNNYGREVFILINTESGWKISGIAFSATGSKKDGK